MGIFSSKPDNEFGNTVISKLDEIERAIHKESDVLKHSIPEAVGNFIKQNKPSDKYWNEERLEAVRKVCIEAFRQQLGTSEPGEIIQRLQSILTEIAKLVKNEEENGQNSSIGRFEREITQVSGSLNEIKDLLLEYERLKPELHEARRIIAGKDRMLVEQNQTREDREDVRQNLKCATVTHQNALKEREQATIIREEAQSKLNGIEENQRRLEDRDAELIRRAEAIALQETQLKDRQHSLDEIEASLTSEKASLSNHRQEYEVEWRRKKEEIDAQFAQAEQARQVATEKEAEANHKHEETQKLLCQSWPNFTPTNEWADFRSSLNKEAVVDSDAAMLLAAVHTFSAAFRSDQRTFLVDALRQIGHLYYKWLTKQIFDENLIAKKAEALCCVFNDNAEQRYHLKVAKPGQPTNSQWMNFKTGLATVELVTNWAVFDYGASQLHHKAIIQNANNDR